jgi:large subunit ribosomal protein L16
MLKPNNYKYKKMHKPRVSRSWGDFKNVWLSRGVYGIKVIESGRIKSKELDSVKKLVSKRLKKQGRVILGIFPDRFTTSKPLEVRMGKGKGNLKDWVCLVHSGCIIVEIEVFGSGTLLNLNLLLECMNRLSLKTKIVKYIV